MNKYGLIAGRKGHILQENVNNAKQIHIDTLWETTKDLILELSKVPSRIIDEMTAIVVLDTGFNNIRNVNESVKEFLVLQDAFVAKGLKNVKLYLITKETEMYTALKGNINGIEGMYYENSEMFLIDKLAVPYVINVYKGTLDKTGVYSSKRKNQSRIERLEMEKQALIENASQVSKEALEYGKKEPISEINQEEIVGSKKHQEKMKKKEFEERKLEREIQSLKSKQEKERLKGLTRKEQEKLDYLHKEKERLEREKLQIQGKDIELVIDFEGVGNTQGSQTNQNIQREPNTVENTPKKETQAVPNRKPLEIDNSKDITYNPDVLVKKNIDVHSYETKGVPSIDELAELYSRLNTFGNDTLETKLKSDKGVISFIGNRGSGVSGMVAQTAETYAMLGKKVLIIDLDLSMRSQTVYFPMYSEAVLQHKGVGNSLIRLTQTQNIKGTAVSVTSNIDVLSNEKTLPAPETGFHTTISNVFEHIIDDAVENYDIVLIDLPLDYLQYYFRHSDKLDKNVFVIENKFYMIEDFFSIHLASIIKSLDVFSEDLISKSSILLNKYRKDFRDLKGYQMNRLKVKEMLMKAGAPYDRISVIGEVPEYKDWEEQYYSNVRYLWTDDIALSMFRTIVSKIL